MLSRTTIHYTTRRDAQAKRLAAMRIITSDYRPMNAPGTNGSA